MSSLKRSASQALLFTRDTKRQHIDSTHQPSSKKPSRRRVPPPSSRARQVHKVARAHREVGSPGLLTRFANSVTGFWEFISSWGAPEPLFDFISPPARPTEPVRNPATDVVMTAPPEQVATPPPTPPPASPQALPPAVKFPFPTSSPNNPFRNVSDSDEASPSTVSTPRHVRRRAVYGTAGVLKTYRRREHIHQGLHRTEVKQKWQRWQEDLYNIQRMHGYSQDYHTFQGYMGYRERLENLEREAFSPARSLSFSERSPAFSVPSVIRNGAHLPPASPHYLQRAIQKARHSLGGPKPPKPFIPSFEKLRLEEQSQDQEIDGRIRGPKKLPQALPPAQQAEVDSLLKRSGLIAKVAREQVYDKDIARLRPAQWLNDEVINFYGALILDRAEKLSSSGKENENRVNGVVVNGVNGVKSSTPKLLKVHYFTTFFYAKLEEAGYEKGRLAKWTKKVDIFKKDVALIPINLGNSHWTCAAINFRYKRIEYYDSMGMRRDKVYALLRSYLDKEHRDKKKKPFDFTGWEDYWDDNVPQQENGYDCGVFSCQFMEALSRGEQPFSFGQKDMPYLRKRMIWEIGRSELGER